ncbi:MAG: nucleoside deaminase [Firmicutes bacterium]|nr:nucleoside deaminase [Bacillota bacterium]
MNKFMELAINEAKKGIRNKEGGPFGSVIVKDGKVVGRGHNKVVANNDPTAHGEMMAIRDACNRLGTFDLTGCELYTTSEPCPMCKCAIMWANIKKVYYGCTVNDAEDIGFRDVVFATQSPESIEVDRAECLNLFEEYKSLDHTNY